MTETLSAKPATVLLLLVTLAACARSQEAIGPPTPTEQQEAASSPPGVAPSPSCQGVRLRAGTSIEQGCMVDCTVRSASGYSTGDNPFPWPKVFAPVGQGEPITVMATPQTTEDIEVCVYAWHGPPELFQIPEELTHVTLPASSGGFWIPELPPGKYALWVKVGWEDVVTRRCYGVDIRSAAQ